MEATGQTEARGDTGCERWQLQLCGEVRMRVDGCVVEIPSGQPRVVIGYLALNRHREVSRAELIEALWPGAAAPTRPEAALSSVLSRLRRRLPISGRSHLRLAPGPELLCDVTVARADLDAARRAARSGAAKHTVELAHRAARTVSAGLLPGTEGLWLREHRILVEDLWLDAMQTVAHAALSLGGSWAARAEQAAKAVIARSPYRESAHVLLMQSLAARGDDAEALRVFDALRVRLADELGIVPGAAARELHARLVRPRPAPAGDPGPELPSRLQAAGRDGPLIGRADALASLVRSITRGRAVVVIDGEPGIGKTRLVAEAAPAAARRGDGVHLVRCGPPLDAALATRHQHDQLEPALAAVRSGKGRALLIVENVHWATDATQRSLAMAVGDLPAVACVVLTTRDGLASQPVLAAQVAELHCERALRWMTLRGLDEAGVTDLVRARTGVEPAARAVARLRERTAGNPLMLCDLLDEHGPALLRDPGGAPPSRGLAELVRTRIAGLGGDLLPIAAAVGADFSPAEVEVFGGRVVAWAPEVIEAAMREGYLAQDGRHPHRFRFRHPLVRETVARSAAGARPAHRRQAAAGEPVDPAEVPATVVRLSTTPGTRRVRASG